MTTDSHDSDNQDSPFRRSRRCALQFLYQADQQDEWGCSDEAIGLFGEQIRELEDCLAEPHFSRAWTFSERLIRGVLEHRDAIDVRISATAHNWRLERMAAVDRCILRMAAYELLFDSKTPAVTAVDEAVELAKVFGHRDSGRFVNGVLDRLLHECKDGESH